MPPEPSRTLSRLIAIAKWGGCFTALVSAVGGLTCELTWAGEASQAVGRGSWIVVAIAMAFGLLGVILDRSHGVTKSSESVSGH